MVPYMHFYLLCVLSRFSHVRLFATLWTVAHQAPLSVEFSRHKYWSGWLFPSPEDIPDSGIKPTPPVLAGRLLTTEPPGEAHDSNLMRSKIHRYFWASLVFSGKEFTC